MKGNLIDADKQIKKNKTIFKFQVTRQHKIIKKKKE